MLLALLACPAAYAWESEPQAVVLVDSTTLFSGSTFDTVDHGVVVKSSDVAFRPVYIANAPDGSLFVSDMYEYYIAHGQHYQNQIDPTTGRIYRISGEGRKLETDLNLVAKTSAQLVAVGLPHAAVRLNH